MSIKPTTPHAKIDSSDSKLFFEECNRRLKSAEQTIKQAELTLYCIKVETGKIKLPPPPSFPHPEAFKQANETFVHDRNSLIF